MDILLYLLMKTAQMRPTISRIFIKLAQKSRERILKEFSESRDKLDFTYFFINYIKFLIVEMSHLYNFFLFSPSSLYSGDQA